MPDDAAPIQPGTLEMLVLKVLSVEPEHGWGIGQRLLGKGWIRSEWRVTDSGRRARYYHLTRSGAARLFREREGWERQVAAVGRVLRWT